MVVNSLFHENSPIAIQVSKSLSVLDNADLKYIDNATVKLFKNDELIETLTEMSEYGFYWSTGGLPESGAVYSIEVSSPDFEQTSRASGFVPEKVRVSDATVLIRDSVFYEWEEYNGSIQYGGQVEGSFTVTLADPAGQSNYYSLSVFYLDTVYYDLKDSSNFGLESRPVYLDTEDAAVENAGDNYYMLLFRDELFEGQSYQIKFDFEDWNARRDRKYIIELNSYQEAAYFYKRSIGEYYQATNDPFAEPVQIYGNIENGYGIFSGYAVDYYIVGF